MVHGRGEGVVGAVSITTGKVIDIEIMSRNCKACVSNEHLKTTCPAEYDIWKNNHDKECQLNYVGSAPNMETTGAKNIFTRSVANCGVRYTGYYGDGDSKSFNDVKKHLPWFKSTKLSLYWTLSKACW